MPPSRLALIKVNFTEVHVVLVHLVLSKRRYLGYATIFGS